MRITIRTKLVILLIAVALLPLLAALATIVIGGTNLRREIFGQSILSRVVSEARVLETNLRKEIQTLDIELQTPAVLRELAASRRLEPSEIQRLDPQWYDLPVDDPAMRRVLSNPAAEILKLIARENEHVAEILITDRYGQLIAATGRTSDFDQSDETWWQRAYDDGKGMVYIPPVAEDKSAGVWTMDICLPIETEGKLVGVAKVAYEISRWLPPGVLDIGGSQGYLYVIAPDGMIVHDEDIARGRSRPRDKRLDSWTLVGQAAPFGSWRTTPNQMIEAYAPIRLEEKLSDGTRVSMRPWTIVIRMSAEESRRGLFGLMLVIGLTGIVMIAVLFLAGLLLIDRSVINRIRRIGQSARRVAEGELQHRAESSWTGTRYTGTDEIDDLARDFNNMVRKLQHSHSELTKANQLKEDFIRIAGHELRTPVSYIVGMASLMKNSRDPDRLAKAIDTMGFKAGRLDEIIQAMFKLIPEQTLAEGLEYEHVDLSEMMEQVYLDVQPWIERRNQRLVIEPGEGRTVIQADRGKLRDIIENLTMNAIKFTRNEGLVKISIQRQLGGYVSIEIVDQGPGVPESDRPHIFEPFYSGSDVLKHSTGKSGYGKKGMGLGLAIVKHFVDLHGGTIDFMTGPNGTTFVVQLPIEPPAHPEPEYHSKHIV